MICRRLLMVSAFVSGALGCAHAAALGAAPMSEHSLPTGARVYASFYPEKPGASTALTVAFKVGKQDVTSLSPLASVEVRLPAGVTSGLDTLGMATCAPMTLQLKGPSGCPSNSLMGWGSATVAMPLGSEIVSERTAVTILMAPAVRERTTLLFYASGSSPIISQNIFDGSLLAGSGSFGAQLQTTIPPIVGLPGSPDVAILNMRTVIGPQGLKYHRRVHGVTIAYRPRGFKVPLVCPHRGFPVSVRLVFADGAHESASSRIPCPSRRRGGDRARGRLAARAARRSGRQELPARRSSVIAVRETARLHLVSHHGATLLNEAGTGSGTFRCPLSASLDTAVGPNAAYTKANLTFKIACPANATISGRGETSYYASGATAHFAGALAVTGGTGRYAHFSGAGFKVSGAIQRNSYALTLSVSGTLHT